MKDTVLRNPEQLGMVIRLKRKELKLSQSDLAKLLGVERKWVLRLEAGNPKAEFALVLRALELVGWRAWLRDQTRIPKATSAAASRLEEVFNRLQRKN